MGRYVGMWHLKLPLNMEETSPNPLIQALLYCEFCFRNLVEILGKSW